MDRREFLYLGAAVYGGAVFRGAVYGGAVGSGPIEASDVDASLKAVEGSDLTLTPKTSDCWELAFKPRRPMRILQVTDTHFSSTDEKDRLSAQTLDLLIRRTNPDLIVHTGDFVNNDSKALVTWGGVEYFNQLERPWALCFGNHDYPVHNSKGSLSLEDFRKSLQNCAMGFADIERTRQYCYRHDHVNSYFGTWQGIDLHYGRVSGWGGYGKWPRGGRLILLNPNTGRFTHREFVI